MHPITAKIIILVILFVDGFLFGHLSLGIKWWMDRKHGKQDGSRSEGKQQKSESIAFLNCFAAGIFFATCMLHMLPEVSESMKEEFEVEYPLAEATAAVGFFFVLMLEQIVTSYCIGKNKKDKNGRTSASKATQAVAAVNEPGVEAKHVQVDILSNSNVIQSPQTQPIDPSFQIVQNEEHDDHGHFDMTSQSKMRTLILVGALSLHAIFEGLVFGLSSGEVGDILGTMSAVLIHKSIIAFSTGMQLVSSEIEHVYLCSAICIFSMMAPLGVGIGILITSLGGETIDALIAVLESFAAGTFFYVTFLELVPHEFVGKHVKHGPLKCAIMFSGFMFMAIFQYLNPEEEE